jgi:O-antigen/teichoic acid export membrane protein
MASSEPQRRSSLRPLVNILLHTGLSKGVTLCSGAVLTFLLARSFTVAEYAVYGLMNTIMWLLPPVAGLTLSAYVSRSVPGKSEREQVGILKVALLSEVTLTLACGLVIVSTGLLKAFVQWTNVADYYWLFAGVLVLIVLNSVQSELAQYAFGKVDVKTANYMDLLLQSGWVPPLLIFALAGRRIDLRLVLAMMMAGSVMSSLLGSRRVDWRGLAAAPFEPVTLRRAALYSMPLVVPAINYGMLRFVDRFFLASMVSMRELGIYTFAGTLVNLLFTLSYRIVYTAIQPYIIRAHNQGDFAQRDLLLTYLLKVSLITFAAGVILFRFGGYRLVIPLVRPDYARSVGWVGWIAVTHALLILGFPGQLLLLLQNRTHLIMVIEIAGLAIVIALSITLIPSLGVLGGILAGWAGWAFVATAEGLASGAAHVIVWRQMWGYKHEIRVGRELLAGALSRGPISQT